MTLIELLVVVFILAAVAVSAVALVDDLDSQTRFDDTRVRLEIIEEAIIGEPRPNGVLAGLAIDTGEIPRALADLFEDPLASTTWVSYGPKTPRFRGVAFASPRPEEILFKGHRGPYISLGPGEDRFRDSWGNRGATAADDDANFGWVLDLDPTVLRITSLGSDGVVGATTGPFSADISIQIPRDTVSSSWQQDISSVAFSVSNETGSAIPIGAGESLFLVVLVYENSLHAGGREDWREVTSSTTLSGSIPTGSTIFAFDSSRVAIGEHLVFLAADGGTRADPSDDSPYLHSGSRVSQRFRLRSRAVPEPIELVLP